MKRPIKGNRWLSIVMVLLFASGCAAMQSSPLPMQRLQGRYAYDKMNFYPKDRNPKAEELFWAALKEGEKAHPDLVNLPVSEEKLAVHYDALWFVAKTFGKGRAGLGQILGMVGLWEEALHAFREAVKEKSNFAGTWGNLGVAAHVTGRYKESMDAFDRALKLDPIYFKTREVQRKVWEASRSGRSMLEE